MWKTVRKRVSEGPVWVIPAGFVAGEVAGTPSPTVGLAARAPELPTVPSPQSTEQTAATDFHRLDPETMARAVNMPGGTL